MKIFSKLYARVMIWSRHRHAERYLAGLSFAESSFFPIPPDVMLAPMSLAKPAQAWRFAFVTTVASLLGGLFGYLLGYFAMGAVEPWITELGYQAKFLQAKQWFDEWGFWAIFIAGFSPIPYKIFTITAGVISMALLPFIILSFIWKWKIFLYLKTIKAQMTTVFVLWITVCSLIA